MPASCSMQYDAGTGLALFARSSAMLRPTMPAVRTAAEALIAAVVLTAATEPARQKIYELLTIPIFSASWSDSLKYL